MSLALKNALSDHNIRKGFITTRIFPLDRAVEDSKLTPSKNFKNSEGSGGDYSPRTIHIGGGLLPLVDASSSLFQHADLSQSQAARLSPLTPKCIGYIDQHNKQVDHDIDEAFEAAEPGMCPRILTF